MAAAVTSSATPRKDGSALNASRRVAALSVLAQFGVFATILVIWETAARAGVVHPFLLPSVTRVVGRLFSDLAEGVLAMAMGATLLRAVTGFTLACCVMVPLGLAMAQFRSIRWFFDPILSIGFPMPKVAFLPIFILWFDVFNLSKILIAAFASSFTILSATYSGALAVDRSTIWSARSLGVGRIAILWEVILPAALPRILTGFQIAMPVAMITTIVAEMVMGGVGIGGNMMLASRFVDSVGVYTGIVAAGLLGFFVIKTLEALRKRLLVWHPEQRSRQ